MKDAELPILILLIMIVYSLHGIDKKLEKDQTQLIEKQVELINQIKEINGHLFDANSNLLKLRYHQ